MIVLRSPHNTAFPDDDAITMPEWWEFWKNKPLGLQKIRDKRYEPSSASRCF